MVDEADTYMNESLVGKFKVVNEGMLFELTDENFRVIMDACMIGLENSVTFHFTSKRFSP